MIRALANHCCEAASLYVRLQLTWTAAWRMSQRLRKGEP